MATTTRKPILIAGAGLASLLLAQSLRRASIPFIVYERDASISFRGQGYRLRLSTEGLDAIESALAPEDWNTFWDTCGKTGGSGFAHIDALTGQVVPPEEKKEEPKKEVSQKDEKPKLPKETLTSRDGKTIGISRGDMRKIFLSGCEPFVQWSRQVTGYEETSSGVIATFADGSKSEEGDMLIGGEGIYSKVAKQLSNGKIKTFDTGARGIHGQAPAWAFKDLGEGVFRLTDESNDKGRVSVITNVRPGTLDDEELGWTMVGPVGVIQAPNDDYAITGHAAASIARSLTAKWHSRVRSLFDNMNSEQAAFWKITCSTPSGVPEWPNSPRVTVIGDAVHSMTPAGGIGANTAVRDSALLGKLIAEAGGFKEGITAAYEKEMRIYGSEAVATSYGTATGMMGIKIDENSPTV
ncbi:FAD-binding domain protein [Venturia nashicola]|uniref:FAD-binding domain protein n=1 Tax=Venturia nashicola TaxID=86259 RepID=A0A4Z1P6I2_9PEZI|nr:FAD-binding domain protein [Venturia nashicola]TLD35227.1 FAD-binding domain protein [Venturia nashicola]